VASLRAAPHSLEFSLRIPFGFVAFFCERQSTERSVTCATLFSPMTPLSFWQQSPSPAFGHVMRMRLHRLGPAKCLLGRVAELAASTNRAATRDSSRLPKDPMSSGVNEASFTHVCISGRRRVAVTSANSQFFDFFDRGRAIGYHSQDESYSCFAVRSYLFGAVGGAFALSRAILWCRCRTNLDRATSERPRFPRWSSARLRPARLRTFPSLFRDAVRLRQPETSRTTTGGDRTKCREARSSVAPNDSNPSKANFRFKETATPQVRSH